MINNCTSHELHERITKKESPILLDVREDEEVAICQLPGALHVPMGDVPSRLTELEEHAEKEIVVYCHHGIRSGSVQRFLLEQGFENVRNLVGGIDAYSLGVDETIPRY